MDYQVKLRNKIEAIRCKAARSKKKELPIFIEDNGKRMSRFSTRAESLLLSALELELLTGCEIDLKIGPPKGSKKVKPIIHKTQSITESASASVTVGNSELSEEVPLPATTQRTAADISGTTQQTAADISGTTQQTAADISGTTQQMTAGVSETTQQTAADVSETTQQTAVAVSATQRQTVISVNSELDTNSVIVSAQHISMNESDMAKRPKIRLVDVDRCGGCARTRFVPETAVNFDTDTASDGLCKKCGTGDENLSLIKPVLWLGCGGVIPGEGKRKRKEINCNYWTHQECIGLRYKDEEELADVPFFCPVHYH